MSDFYIKIGKEEMKIQKEIFELLLDIPTIKDYTCYKNALIENKININDLKFLSEKACIPYPLFFAPLDKVLLQIKDKDSNLADKLPDKDEMSIALRGGTSISDIEIIVKDIGKKQEFLKNRILDSKDENKYVGIFSKSIKMGVSDKEIAEQFRDYFDINLLEMRKLSKDGVLSYLCRKIEEKYIFISMSSYNYMPQNLDREIGLSGLCIKDKIVPYVFINTRDGDLNPKILETSGRQIFTLVSMMVCIGMNKFVLSTKTGLLKDSDYKRVYSIASEILIPGEDLDKIVISSVSDLDYWAKSLKVTPSMLLVCMVRSKKMTQKVAKAFLKELKDRLKSVTTPKRQPTDINGYKKYNGERFSKEVVNAYKSGKIRQEEVKNALFRRNKMEGNLFNAYISNF